MADLRCAGFALANVFAARAAIGGVVLGVWGAMLAPTPVMANPELLGGVTLTCSFTTQCQGGSCAATDFGVDVALPETFPAEATLLPPTGPIDGVAQLVGNDLQIIGFASAAVGMLVRDADGTAEFALGQRADDGIAVYAGRCRVAM